MIDKKLNIFDDLCTGCGACVEACLVADKDKKAIEIIKNDVGLSVPRINNNVCIKCMSCYKTCPNENKIYKNEVNYEKYLSSLGSPYYGYSLDKDHRFWAATAGIVTEIAVYLLGNSLVDGVLSSYQDKNNNIVTEIFTDSKRVKDCKGSIYRQVTLLNGLVQKIKSQNYKKLLVVGLPCHILGLKSLKKSNKYLKNVEFITVALFCKQTKTEDFSKFERKFLGGNRGERIDYRGMGWPGYTRVKSGKKVLFNNIRFSLMWSNFVFTPNYCFTCSDPLGSIADISVGDAWLKRYLKDKTGSSLFFANTQTGEKILEIMQEKKKIFLENEAVQNIVNSQSAEIIKFKTSNISYRNYIFGGKKETEEEVSENYKSYIKSLIKRKRIYTYLYNKNIIKIFPEVILKVVNKVLNRLRIKI